MKRINQRKVNVWAVAGMAIVAILFALPLLFRWIWEYRTEWQAEETKASPATQPSGTY